MNRLALCIGINDYPGTDMDLSGCVNDANDWSNLLEQHDFKVKKLLDKEATKTRILEEMRNIIKFAKSGDEIIFQFFGHGTYIPDEDGDESDGTDECLVPYDIMENGPISDDELFELYSSKSKGVKLIMISDCCHSGTIAKFAPIITPPTTINTYPPQRKVRFMPPAVFLDKKDVEVLGTTSRTLRRASPPGRYGALLISGCQDYEYSYDAYFNGRPNGAFTYVALDTLKKLKKGSTYKDWHKAIRKLLPSQQYPQMPNLFGSSSMKSWKIFTNNSVGERLEQEMVVSN